MSQRIVILMLISGLAFGWGKTGHRVAGKIAEENLSKKARKEITALMGHTDLARVANWPDEIKSDSTWDHSHDWHYCTVLEGHTYEGADAGGQAVEKVQEFIQLLKSGEGSQQEQLNALRFLVHIVADLHQPLHVGNGTDRGGNDVKVKWFWKDSNLHRVWDSEMIDHLQYSYTEFAQQIQLGMQRDDKQALLNPDVLAFVMSSRNSHPQVYDIGDGKLSWEYVYHNQALLEQRLLEAGYHLAAILNHIYD